MKATQVNWIATLLFCLALLCACSDSDNKPQRSEVKVGEIKAPLSKFQETKLEAEKGDAKAQFYLGRMYEKGDGVAKDDVEAVKWYRKAAEQNYPLAQFSLSVMYAGGEGVAEDYVEAYAWCNLAAKTYEDAAKFRDVLEKELTSAQVAAGRKRTKELQALIDAKKK